MLTAPCRSRSPFVFSQMAARSVTVLQFLLAADLVAQENTELTSVRVHILDVSNAPVPGAYVRLFPSSNRPTVTSVDGGFSFTMKPGSSFTMKPGSYDLVVEVAGFREVAKHVEVLVGQPTILNVTMQIGSCPPGPCLTVTPWDSSVALSVSDAEHQGLTLSIGDLDQLKHEDVLFNDATTKATESYSGFSLADALERFCGAKDCAPGIRAPQYTYAVISGNSDFIVFPLARILDSTSGDKIVVADRLGGMALPNNGLRAFLIENRRVSESVHGMINVRLTSPR